MHIVSTPGTCGGRPRIAGRRITVDQIAFWHESLGRSADEVANDYDLTLGSVHAALACYFDHREEIERDREEGRRIEEAMESTTDSKLAKKLRDRLTT